MSRAGPGPFGPLSMNSNDSFASRYGSTLSSGTPNDVPYSGGPYGAARPSQASPPGSQHPSSSTDASRPSASGSSMNRPPSSASSVGGFFPPPSRPDSGRSQIIKPGMEDALQRHYGVLKSYLASHLQDEKGNMKPNRARDKLLRLSATQFMELSTDVYDELIRRQDERLQRRPDVPRFLLPKQNYHPKRNQARQKLSTLPIERFRQLATDVFFELERRIPRVAGGAMERPNSAASNMSRNGLRPPPGGPGSRAPPSAPGGRTPVGPNGMAPPNAPYQSFSSASPGPNGGSSWSRLHTGGSGASNLGRPLPKTFQSNTIVPNKSTMVEDDDNDEYELVLDKAIGERFSQVTSLGNAEDREKKIKTQEMEINELKLRVEKLKGAIIEKEQQLDEKQEELGHMKDLQNKMLDQQQELERVKNSGRDREEGLSSERNAWFQLREELEQKHIDAQHLNENLQGELDHLKRSKSRHERDLRQQHDQNLEDLRAQLNNMHNQTSDLHRQLRTHQAENAELRSQLQRQSKALSTPSNGGYERRIELLQEELANQEKLTNEVRDEAMLYLQEMRDLSRQNDYAMEQEEQLAARVSAMGREIEGWRQRYAKLKAQNRTLRASTYGLGTQSSFDFGSLERKEDLVTEGGLVRDVDVTRFQLTVDELLKVARQTDTQAMLDSVKSIAICVQSITSAVGTDGYPTPSPSPLSPRESSGKQPQPDSVGRLKAKIITAANNLITATKQHASASGLSPVALLDAAASHLTASIVELIKVVGIKPSTTSDLQSDLGDGGDDIGSFYDDRLSPGDQRATPVHVPASAVQVSTPETKPAPPSIGRTTSTKGWFGGWGKRSVDETPGSDTANGHENAGQGQEEYDPYR